MTFFFGNCCNILYSFCIVAVANYHKCNLKQQKVFSHSQGGQKSEITFTRLNSGICQDGMLLGALIKESVSSLFKISSGHLYSCPVTPFSIFKTHHSSFCPSQHMAAFTSLVLSANLQLHYWTPLDNLV